MYYFKGAFLRFLLVEHVALPKYPLFDIPQVINLTSSLPYFPQNLNSLQIITCQSITQMAKYTPGTMYFGMTVLYSTYYPVIPRKYSFQCAVHSETRQFHNALIASLACFLAVFLCLYFLFQPCIFQLFLLRNQKKIDLHNFSNGFLHLFSISKICIYLYG